MLKTTFYDNHFRLNNQNLNEYSQIINQDKLYIGQKYLLVTKLNNSQRIINCGILINKKINENYLSIYFCMGHAYYDNPIIQEQIHQYHIPSKDLSIKVDFYNYYLYNPLQYQIKQFYQKKLITKLCTDYNICNNIEVLIISFL